ncbi:MAG TPA: DedA family protein [Usitatibacter sp.]|jgi:membrane protein DedA with SNARE-associated domain|nr:DedA family protein [Usitatibacter sp.]
MTFDLAGLIESYGYLAVFVGAFLEGETVLALAGLAASRGYLDFYTVAVVALIAGFAGDQFYFFLGRRSGTRILARFPGAQARAHRFDELLARWHAPLIVAIRFMYGFRVVGPILLGMGRVPAWKFMVFNFLGAAIWAPLIAGIGYAFGSILNAVLADVQRYEIWLFASVIAAGIIGVVVHHVRSRTES